MTTDLCQTLWRATILAPLLIVAGSFMAGCDSDSDNALAVQRAQLNNPAQNCSVQYVPRADEPEMTFEVPLQTRADTVGAASEKNPTIRIPVGRPIYALLVSGYHQNRNLDMFHYYKFAKCLLASDAYVHYAWWNNLLAPYMEKPLHNEGSIPSIDGFPEHDIFGFIWGVDILEYPGYPTKAVPAEDHQFQQDAAQLLKSIREHNPHAAIVLVGHSMGGDAVARLGASIDIDIDLLAPIDPVGNRTCIELSPGSILPPFCAGWSNFTRYRAVHEDYVFPPPPFQRSFGPNVKYLYHRWQEEFTPPFDFQCPGDLLHPPPPIALCQQPLPFTYLFGHPELLPVIDIHRHSRNVQSKIETSLLSGMNVPTIDLLGGPFDGHGEIVGFRGVKNTFLPNVQDAWREKNFFNLFNVESYALALAASDAWPSLDKEQLDDDGNDINEVRELRVQLLKEWEAYSTYLDALYGPTYPDYCMVSDDLCTILRTKVNLPPEANAGPDQLYRCRASVPVAVTLDGSGSSDANDEPLTFTWDGEFGTLSGKLVSVDLSPGEHVIALTVTDSGGKVDTDTVLVSIR